MKGVVMAADLFGFIREIKREAFVDLYGYEMTCAGNRQSEDVGEELRRRDFILRRYDRVI
jgi:hypothetical protein